MRRVSTLPAICLMAVAPVVHGDARPVDHLAARLEAVPSVVLVPLPTAGRTAPSPQVDSVFVAGFVATPGWASDADGEALAEKIVRFLGDSGYPALFGGMEPCIRARQQAALRSIRTVVCGRLLMTTATHHEVEFMVVSPGSEFGPALLRGESLDLLAEQVHRRFLREVP